jgi:hypothetical protein
MGWVPPPPPKRMKPAPASRAAAPAPVVAKVPSRGLGDTIKKFTDATGITRVAKVVERVTGKPCGCGARQKKLNQLVPYATPQQEEKPAA